MLVPWRTSSGKTVWADSRVAIDRYCMNVETEHLPCVYLPGLAICTSVSLLTRVCLRSSSGNHTRNMSSCVVCAVCVRLCVKV